MRFLRGLFVVASLFIFSISAVASSASPKEGEDYQILSPAQSAESGKQVEVIEFFGYHCPHCNAFDPVLHEWVKKQGSNIVFKRIHTAFHESILPQQRMYFTLEAMGKAEELHEKIFKAIHVDHKPLNKEDGIVEFVVAQGIDKQKFLDVYNSFAVQTKVRRAKQMQETYKIEGVPTVVVEGKYVTSPSIVSAGMPRDHQTEPELQVAAVNVLSTLVDKVASEHGHSSEKGTLAASAKSTGGGKVKSKAPAKEKTDQKAK